MAVYEYKNEQLNRIAGGTLYSDAPIGVIQSFGGTVAPMGWFICDGSALSRTTYADLFAVIGTAFGSGDGSTTFNIPDMREATAKGAGLTSKSNNHYDADGLAVGEFIDDRVQNHQHKVNATSSTGNAWIMATNALGGGGFLTGLVDDTNARTGTTTEVKSVGVNWIIKAQSVGVPADFVDAIDDVIGDKLSYSTTEINTGRKWIDGKYIYRKVVEIPFTAGVPVSVTISGVTLSDFQVIDMGHSFIYSSDYGTRQPWGANGNSDVAVFYMSGGTIKFTTTHPDGTFYAVVEYTKTS